MAITSYQAVDDAIMQGKARWGTMNGIASGTTTAAAANSGSIPASMLLHGIGTTLPGGPFQGFPAPPGIRSTPARLIYAQTQSSRAVTYAVSLFYLLGTVNFTATGQRFTRDATWTAPLLRTRMGVASQPFAAHLYLHMTAAMATTAAQFTLKYVNQAGSTITGARNFTMPSATTAAGSGFLLMLEDGDSAARDLIEMNVSVAATAGTGNVYLCETIGYVSQPVISLPGIADYVRASPPPRRIDPAVATTGTVPYIETMLNLGGSATNTPQAIMLAVNA